VSSRANLSAFASRYSAAAVRIFARFVMGVFFQPANAAAAASTAAWASSFEEAWKRPTISRVSAGFTSSNVFFVRLETHSPSM
jgi:hypothetical protein